MSEETLTVEEVRRLLRLGRNSVYSAVKRGDIPSIRIGGAIRVPRARLVELLGGELAPISGGGDAA